MVGSSVGVPTPERMGMSVGDSVGVETPDKIGIAVGASSSRDRRACDSASTPVVL